MISQVHYMNAMVTEMNVEASSPAESVEPYVKDEAVDGLIMGQEPVKEEHQSKWSSYLYSYISVICYLCLLQVMFSIFYTRVMCCKLCVKDRKEKITSQWSALLAVPCWFASEELN
jgi:hypothetical protein